MRGTNEELIAFVARLKGQKVLIKGNHDQVKDFRYKQLFSEMHCRHTVGQDARAYIHGRLTKFEEALKKEKRKNVYKIIS